MNKRIRKENRQSNRGTVGFTLVELIVVLVILSILSAVAVPSVLGFIDDSKAKECRTQVEALTAEISSAKLAYEANGEVNSEKKFDKGQVDMYIEDAGDEGCCPVSGDRYIYDESNNMIKCPKGHGEGVISNSGKFTVAVVEETEKRESPDEVLPPKNDEEDSEKKSELGLVVPPVTVKEGGTGRLNPEGIGGSGKYTFQFESLNPERVTVNESTGEVTGVTPGAGKVRVTITDTETGKTVTKDVDVKVTPKLDLQVPESQSVGVNQTKPLGDVEVEGGSGNYTITYESLTPGTVSVNETTGEITGVGSGQGTIAVTVTDTETGETVTKEVPVKVTPKLDLQVPEGQEVEAGKTKPLGDVKVEGGSGNYTITYESLTSDTVSVNETTGEITGGQAGDDGRIKVTVTDNETGETVTKEVPVTVTNPKTGSSTESETNSPLDLKVPPLSVEEGKTGQLKPETTGGSGDYTYEYKSLNPETVTVDENGTVHGEKSGNTQVEVTVTDNKTKEKKTVTVEVKVTGGLFNPNVFQVWAYDNAGIEIESYDDAALQEIFHNLPKGTWYDASGGYFNIENRESSFDLTLFPKRFGGDGTGPFTLRFVTEDGREDTLTFKVGYPIKGLQMPIIDHLQKQLNEQENCRTVLDPDWTTDLPIQWELDPASTAKIEWTYEDARQTSINMTMLSEGAFRIRAFARCEKTGKNVYSKWSQTVTVGNVDNSNIQWSPNEGQNLDITGVTLDPTQMTLETGESQTVTATILTKAGSVIDLDKVTYSFNKWGTPWDSIDMTNTAQANTATVTGKNAGNSTITVGVLYDGVEQENINAQCQVTVVESTEETETETLLPNEVEIDGKQFGAMSWKEF